VLLSPAGDHRLDIAPPELPAVLVVVIAAVCDRAIRALAWSPAAAFDRADPVHQRQQLGDVVAVSPGQRERERDAVRVDDQMVF
jgi:hypothetical protein